MPPTAKVRKQPAWVYGLASLFPIIVTYFSVLLLDRVGWVPSDALFRLSIFGLALLPSFVLLAIWRDRIQREYHPSARWEVGPLPLLYVGIASAAFVTALNVTILPSVTGTDAPAGIPVDRILLLVAFLATAVPFYHGAMAYLLREQRREGRDAIIDFVILLAEALILLMLAASSSEPSLFVGWLVGLLAIDSSWLAYTVLSKRPEPPPGVWFLLNVSTILFLVMVLSFGLVSTALSFLLLLAGVSVGRTVVDYAVAWPLYFRA